MSLFSKRALLAALLASSTAAIAQDYPARGLAVQAKSLERIATVNFTDLYGIKAPLSDQTVNIQDGLFEAQQAYYRLKSQKTYYDDQLLVAHGVRFTVPGFYCLSSPIVVPEHVELHMPLSTILCGSLSATNSTALSYGGDPTSQALANHFQPMVIIPIGASTADLLVYNHSGTGATLIVSSGVALGKTWTTNGATIAAGGSGYTVGDVLTAAQPSKAPYSAPTFTVAAIGGSGAVTGVTPLAVGNYAMPPLLQRRYWTAAKGFAGTPIVVGNRTQVFDPATPGAYLTAGGTGTGAELTLSFVNDFNGTGGDYDMGSGLGGDMHTGDITTAAGSVASNPTNEIANATFGHTFGIGCRGLQFNTGTLNSNGNYYGIKIDCTDFHPKGLHPTDGAVNLRVMNGGSVETADLVDDTWSIAAIQADQVSNLALRGVAFHRPDIVGVATAAPFQWGANSSSTTNEGNANRLDITLNTNQVFAPGTSAPALSCAWTRSSNFTIRVVNGDKGGTTVANPATGWGNFGAHCEASNTFAGSIDQGAQTLLTGTPPLAQYNIWDTARSTVETGPGTIPLNVLFSRNNLTTSAWVQTNAVPVVANTSATAAPDGSYTATQVTLGTLSTDRIAQQIKSNATTDKICSQIFAKAGTGNAFSLITGGNTYANTTTVQFALGSNSLYYAGKGGLGSLISYTVNPYPNGWYRISSYSTVGETYPSFQIVATNTTPSTFYFWGASAQVNPRTCPGNVVDPPLTNTIFTTDVAVAYVPQDGTLYAVSGNVAGKAFVDLVMATSSTATVVSSATVSGTPAARTYSVASGALNLHMGDGSGYVVTATPQGARTVTQ